ncbi:MAG: DUF1801 domain-containing protein [Candidatus Marsarchaeota archaeon]|nr:DUF1801 domain-containing protein [Candidatus Marsarchaeota archaeon]
MKKTGKKAGLSKEETDAMKDRLKELNDSKNPADREKAVIEKIATMVEPDRTIGKRLHTIIKANAPSLLPRLWYGMPAYSDKEGNVILFFRDRAKFGERYMTLGFNNEAKLDDGDLWPIVFALTKLTSAEETKIAALVKRAVR